MRYLDEKMVKEMKEEIEDTVFSDEYGECIDSLADLDTDKDIIDKCLGGNCDEL